MSILVSGCRLHSSCIEGKETDIEIIQVPQEWINERIVEVKSNTDKILMLKIGEIDPIRCDVCDYCKHTKVLTAPIWPDELLGEV